MKKTEFSEKPKEFAENTNEFSENPNELADSPSDPTNLCEEDTDAAADETEDNGEDEEIYNEIRDIVENAGVRYFIEHRMFRDIFFTDPYGIMALLTEGGTEETRGFFAWMQRRYNLSPVPAFSKMRATVREDVPGGRCVHLTIPDAEAENDCTDILLVISDEKPYYFTVEMGGFLPGKAKQVCFLCGWDVEFGEEDGTGYRCEHLNYGLFKSREKALEKFKEKIKAL